MSVVVTNSPEVGVTVLPRWIFNCYLVLDGGDGRAPIVDPGMPSTAAAAVAMLDKTSGPTPVVVATHGHSRPLTATWTMLAGCPICTPSDPRSVYLEGFRIT